jgi:hypothetical protein
MVKRWRFAFFLASTFLFGVMFAEFQPFSEPVP